MNNTHDKPERRVLKRHNAQEREQLIKKYKNSGKSRQAFCVENGIPLTTFHGWFKKAKKRIPGFLQVDVAGKPAPIEIEMPGGFRIGIYLNGDQKELALLLKAVLCGKEA